MLYAHALTGGFASYDDAPQIIQNPSLSSLAASLKYFQSPVSFASDLRGSGGSFYRPLFWLSLAIDEKLWGLNPVAFHLANVLLHWLSGLFLFLLLRRLHMSSLSSALTSLLWICLPINSPGNKRVSRLFSFTTDTAPLSPARKQSRGSPVVRTAWPPVSCCLGCCLQNGICLVLR